jgi:hypothetical protein
VVSFSHEGFVLLFRNRPELAVELARSLGVPVPAFTEARIESADLTEIVPTEYRADLIVLLVDGVPVLAIIVEVQLARDADKSFSWPMYASSARARFRCPAFVLVVTPDDDVARWAAAPIALGPGGSFTPVVVGPRGVPTVTEPDAAASDPELAVLSAMAHGRGDVETAVRVALAAERACAMLQGERALIYSDLVWASLGDAARRALEDLMATTHGYEYQSEHHRRLRAEALREGLRDVLLRLLAARFGPIDEATRTRIVAASIDDLNRWVDRVVTAPSVADVLGT